ncbi:MAG TPA: hypothetical protein VKJ45_28270 [Blastocatellia bacterium]|nr:hypothetical protein [Blastocatellia bacterium]
MKGQGPLGNAGIVGAAHQLVGAAPHFALALTLIGNLFPNPAGLGRWIAQAKSGPAAIASGIGKGIGQARPGVDNITQNPLWILKPASSGPALLSPGQDQSSAQNKNEQPRPVKRLSPIEIIRKHMQRLGYSIDESKSRPDMIVSNYSDAKKGKVTIVIVYDRRKEVVGFYVYNFGNVDKAVDAGALNKYLLNANDEIIIGGLFVDKEGDIGYKYVSAVSQLSIASFEAIYVTMAGVALERRAQIRRLIDTGKTEEGQGDNDTRVKRAGSQH